MTALHPEAQKQEDATIAQDQTVAHQPVDTKLAQEQPKEQQAKTEIEEVPTRNGEDPDWNAFREARKRDRAERRAAEERAQQKEAEAAALKAAMEAAFGARQAPSQQAYQQYYGMDQQPEESEEQRLERKLNEMLAKKEEQWRREQAEQEAKSYPQRLMRDFPDFSQVCSQENLDYLDYHYPEISRPLQRLGDGYDKWHDTYHAVKKLIPNHSSAKKEALRAEVNTNKPKSMSSMGQSATGRQAAESWQEIEARRAENWQRMQRTMKGV